MVNRLDVHTFIYFELASSSIVLVRYRPQFSRQAYSFLEVNQRRLRRNTWECKYDTRNLLYLQTVLIIAGPGVTICNASKQHVHGKRHIFVPQKQILGDFKIYLAIEMTKKQYTNTWQIIEVSNSNEATCR